MSNNNENNTNKEPELGAIWEKVSSTGTKYLSIKVKNKKGEDVNLVAFLNKFKQNDNQPTYRIYASKKIGVGQEAPKAAAPKPAPVAVADDSKTDF